MSTSKKDVKFIVFFIHANHTYFTSTSTALKQISALYRCSNAYNFVSKCNIVIFVTFAWLQAKVANKVEVLKLFGLGNEANARGIKD